jgi:predicted MPP superfamily phosphohydrolase
MSHPSVRDPGRVSPPKGTLKILGFSLGILLTGLAVWAIVIEPSSLRVENYSVAVPGWPVHLSGLRIAILADLHTGSPFNDLNKLREIVETTNAGRLRSHPPRR